MKGNPMKRNFGLPGINNKSEGNTDKPDGRSASSAFQYHDDTKKDSEDWNRSHWPDGTARSAREIFDYEESMDEERRDNERQEPVTKKPDPMMKAGKSPTKHMVDGKWHTEKRSIGGWHSHSKPGPYAGTGIIRTDYGPDGEGVKGHRKHKENPKNVKNYVPRGTKKSKKETNNK